MRIFVTGVAGFIGAAVAEQLLTQGHTVTGLDNLNDYYEVALKHARLAPLLARGLVFHHADVVDQDRLFALVKAFAPTHIVHLAAQVGVRYSIGHPEDYVSSNLVGFCNILEACRQYAVAHLIYASSSSVYGDLSKLPFSELDQVDEPLSLYAATKKSNELMAHAYSHLYGFATTGLRYFTVYGPWGRPDMAPYKFCDAIANGQPIHVYNQGHHRRDFTYIDDICRGTIGLLDHFDPGIAEIYNIGNGNSVALTHFISVLEAALGKKAVQILESRQIGDVAATEADISKLQQAIDYQPRVTLEEGILRLVDWYLGR